jgi:hypothetical protein
LARAILGVSDNRGAQQSFLSNVVAAVGKITALRGKALPKADAQAVAMEVEQGLKERGYDDASVRSKKSAALKLALCSPVLATVEAKSIPGLTEGLAPMLRFCTALRKNGYDKNKAKAEFVKSTTGSKRKNVARSIAIHVKSILSAKGSHAAASPAAKKALMAWASKFHIVLNKAATA